MSRNPMLSSISGHQNPQWRIEASQRFRAQNLNWKRISIGVGVHSKATPWRWAHSDMSPTAINERSRNKAHNRLLSWNNENVGAGYLVMRDCQRLDTSTDVSGRFFHGRYNANVTPSWTSKWANRHHLSLRSTLHTSTAEFLRFKRDNAIGVLDRIRGLQQSSRKIWSFDKKSFTDRSTSSKQYGPKNSCKFP